MEELLREQLEEYKVKYSQITARCVELMQAKQPWHEKAKIAAGYKIMIEGIEAEIKKWES